MARSKKKKDGGSKAPKTPDPLGPGLTAFDDGDYVEARRLLEPLTEDSDLSSAQRQQAKDTVEATQFERGALLVGLACLGLFLFAVLFTALKQP